MTPQTDVFAVIVTDRHIDSASRCAASLGLAPDLVVIVSNAAASSGSMPWNVVSPPAPQGYSANINLGASHAPPGTRWLLLLNDDVVFEPGTLARLAAAIGTDAKVGAITPALHGEDGRPQVVGFRHPTLRSELAALLAGPELARRVLRRGDCLMPSGSGVTHADWVLGAALLVRAAAFAEVGGFDEHYFLYSEDTQFGLDLERRGWRSAVLNDAWALHVGAMSTTEARWSAMLVASRRQYLRANWPRPRRAALDVLWVMAQLWNAVYLAGTAIRDRSRSGKRATEVRAQLRQPPWRQR